MSEPFVSVVNHEGKPMMIWCEDDYFQDMLTKEEKLAFTELAERVAEAEKETK